MYGDLVAKTTAVPILLNENKVFRAVLQTRGLILLKARYKVLEYLREQIMSLSVKEGHLLEKRRSQETPAELCASRNTIQNVLSGQMHFIMIL